WIGRGCVLVNLYYGTVPSPTTVIASSIPNTGQYLWTVPSVATGSSYRVRVECLTSTGVAAGANADSDQFTIANSDVQLMNPGRAFRAVNQSTLRVAWKRNNSFTGNVTVGVRTGTSGETTFGPFSGNFADITLPSAVNNSSRVRVRAFDSGNTA